MDYRDHTNNEKGISLTLIHVAQARYRVAMWTHPLESPRYTRYFSRLGSSGAKPWVSYAAVISSTDWLRWLRISSRDCTVVLYWLPRPVMFWSCTAGMFSFATLR